MKEKLWQARIGIEGFICSSEASYLFRSTGGIYIFFVIFKIDKGGRR